MNKQQRSTLANSRDAMNEDHILHNNEMQSESFKDPSIMSCLSCPLLSIRCILVALYYRYIVTE